MPYEFNPIDADRFAAFIGIPAKRTSRELTLEKCPYCQNMTKDKKTFSISLITGQYNCLRSSCGAKGNMLSLAKDFGLQLSGMEYEAKREYTIWRKFPKKAITDKATEYLNRRGISKQTAERFHVTQSETKGDGIIVFPFYDEAGEDLVFIKFRNIEYKKGDPGAKEWCSSNTKPILFGMDSCDALADHRLWMTEGQIDAMSLAEIGIRNVVSVPTGAKGFTWYPHCREFLQKFDELVVFGDFEHGEVTLLDEMIKRFDGKVYRVSEEGYQGHKDANDILKEIGADALRKACESVQQIQIGEILQMCDVKQVNIDDLEKIGTGIKELNKIIKGFYFGQLLILTGRRGEGKSTLAGQFGTKAIADGYPTFFYSGELTSWYFRMWMDRQVAGPDIVRYGRTDYFVPTERKKEIDQFYRDKAYLFDNSCISSDEYRGIVDVMKKAYRLYGCRVFIIDNLMTAISDDQTSDIYQHQTAFVKELAFFAKTMNAIVFLVAHPKKTDRADIDNDDVSGSSNITNLADVVMTYSRPPRNIDGEQDTESRLIRVTKNRLTGKLELNGIRLEYDEASKRISSSGEYKWNILKSEFEMVGDGDENPFE